MRVCFGALLLLAIGCPTIAQVGSDTTATTSTRRQVFDVASVKQNVSGSIGGAIQVPPTGMVTFTNVELRVLIRNAYDMGSPESKTLDAGPYAGIVGQVGAGPQSNVPRFDVRGKPSEGTAPTDRRAMMRSLLEDRFKLKVHRELRPMPVYVLTLARAGRLGPNLAPSTFDCRAYNSQRRYGVGTPPEPVDSSGRSWCPNYVDVSNPGAMTERSAGPIKVLVERLQNRLDRPLLDETGLSGNFEWTLTFGAAPDASDDAPPLLTAVQDQLGLKVASRSARVEVLVIDHVEMPTPD